MKYQFVLETGNWKPEFWNPGLKTLIFGCWAKKQELIEKKVQNLDLTAEPCRKPKTNNQQLSRNKLKMKLKYEVKLMFETQIWKPENEKSENLKAEFQEVYFKKSSMFSFQ